MGYVLFNSKLSVVWECNSSDLTSDDDKMYDFCQIDATSEDKRVEICLWFLCLVYSSLTIFSA